MHGLKSFGGEVKVFLTFPPTPNSSVHTSDLKFKWVVLCSLLGAQIKKKSPTSDNNLTLYSIFYRLFMYLKTNRRKMLFYSFRKPLQLPLTAGSKTCIDTCPV